MAEFKKLSDVNVIESISDSTNVLVEENGTIVKMAANSMIPEDVALKGDIPTGIVKSVNSTLPDEHGNVEITIPAAISELENDAGYLTEHQDLSEYAKAADVIPTPATATVGQTVVVKAVDESGKPTEWEVKDAGNSLPELSANKWLVTDSEGNAVWEDKPFGEVRQYNVVCAPYDNQSVVSGHSSLEMHIVNGVYYEYEFPLEGNMVVIYDGTEYECSIYFNRNSSTSGYWMIGNQSLSEYYAGENNEMPFCFYFSGNVSIGSSTGNVSVTYVYFNDNAEHTISLNIVDEVVKTLDQKYIPEFILPSSTEGSTKKFKLTVDDSGTITAQEVT